MKIGKSGIIKQIRNEMKLTQAQMAERLYVSHRHYIRIESGETNLDIWQFISMFSSLGLPTEDYWLLYLSTEEFKQYRTYKKIRRLLSIRKLDEIGGLLTGFEKSTFAENKFIQQFIFYLKTILNTDLLPEEAIKCLKQAMKLSISNFAESDISLYRLNYNEINILVDLAYKYYETDDINRAIAILSAIIDGRESSITSEEDIANLFPAIMSNLSTMLGSAGRYSESLALCERALKVCREYNKLEVVPTLLYNTACCYHLMDKDAKVYTQYLLRAYYSALAFDDTENANIIKNDAEKSFGVIIKD